MAYNIELFDNIMKTQTKFSTFIRNLISHFMIKSVNSHSLNLEFIVSRLILFNDIIFTIDYPGLFLFTMIRAC